MTAAGRPGSAIHIDLHAIAMAMLVGHQFCPARDLANHRARPRYGDQPRANCLILDTAAEPCAFELYA
jgi:hypothetical protein